MHGFENQGTYLPEVDQKLLPVPLEVDVRSRSILLQFTDPWPTDTYVFVLPHKINSNYLAQQKRTTLTPMMSASHATERKMAICVMLKWAGLTPISTNPMSRPS